MIDATQFRQLVIKPTLLEIDMHSEAAEVLLLGTAITESGLKYLRQHGDGPARGVYQIEPATMHDVWLNYLAHRSSLEAKIQSMIPPCDKKMLEEQLVTNLAYSTAIARICYFRKPDPMPKEDDIEGLAAYWKQHYNTPLGAGKVEHFIEKLQDIL